MQQPLPALSYEKIAWKKGFLVAGIDEVGRGAFAGPLTFAAICFKPTKNKRKLKRLEDLGINDSNKLTPKKREALSKVIKNEAFLYHIVDINHSEIDKTGIAESTRRAVRKLATDLQKKTNKKLYLLIDAFYVKYVKGVGIKNQKAIVHGDQKSISIAAASIIAKVHRDKLMKKLAKKYPNYGLDKHKGYGTKAHREMIKKYGPSKIHRQLFLRKMLKLNNNNENTMDASE